MKILNLKAISMALLIFWTVSAFSQSSISGPSILCENLAGVYTYSSTPAVSAVTWSVTPGSAGFVMTTSSTVANILWLHAGTYTITAGSATLSVTVNATPVPAIIASTHVACTLTNPEGPAAPKIIDHDDDCDRVCEYSTVVYQTAAHPGSTYSWQEAGAASYTAVGEIYTVNWGAAAGIAGVRVIETSADGCVAAVTLCAEGVASPHAAIGAVPSPSAGVIYSCAGLGVQFLDMSTILSTTTQPNHITNYYWDFGDVADPTPSTAQNPTHIYSLSGIYSVTLHVQNQCGCEDVAHITVNVNTTGPEIFCPTTKCHDDTANYYTTASCAVYNWSITNGTFVPPPTTSSTSVHVVWGNGNSGPGQVTLSTPSCSGFCATPTTVTVPILPAVPTIDGPSAVCYGQTYTYTVPMIPSTTYLWTVTPSSNATIIIQDYQTQILIRGNCTISVTMTNTFYGCTGTASKSVTIRPDMGINNDDDDNGILCQGSTHTFDAGGTGPGYSTLLWHIEDDLGNIVPGTSYTGDTYTQTYSTPGVYTVVVEDATGFFCTPRLSEAFVVEASPVPLTGISAVTCICPGQLYTYSSTSTDPSLILRWTATGAATGTTQEQVGNAITLAWSGSSGMSLDVVQVGPTGCPSPAFSTPIVACALPSGPIGGQENPCENSVFTYDAPVTDADEYHWSISPSDAGSIVSTTGYHVDIQWHNIPPGATSPFTLTLTAIRCGSTQVYTKSINVIAAPTPDITAGNLCNGSPLTFSTSASGDIYTWTVNGTASGTNSPTLSVTPPASTNVGIGLTVHYTCGASSSNTVNFAISESPLVNIDPDGDAHICSPATSVTLTAVVGHATSPSYVWTSGGGTVSTTSTYTATSTGTYQLAVTSGTCTTTVSKVVDNNCTTGGGCTAWTGAAPNFSSSLSCFTASFIPTGLSGSPTVSWDFGEVFSTSNTATGTTSIAHDYERAGIFMVTMYVTYSGYCTITIQHPVTINNSIYFKSGVTCNGSQDVVTLTNMSTSISGTPTYTWSTSPSGMGTASGADYSVTPTATTPASITVTLSIPSLSCSVTQTVSLPYIVAPVITAVTPACADLPITLTVPTTANIASLQWRWAPYNGSDALPYSNLSTTGRVAFIATGVGKHVYLDATDIYGCHHTTNHLPYHDFDNDMTISFAPVSPQCLGTVVTIAASVSSFIASSFTYQWSDGSHFSPAYTDQVISDGNYIVTVTDNNGCMKSATIPVTFIKVPIPILTGPLDACEGNNVHYSTTDFGPGSGFQYKWTINSIPQPISTLAHFNTSAVPPYVKGEVQLVYTAPGPITCVSTSYSLTTIVHPKPAQPAIAISGNQCLDVAPVTINVSSPLSGGTYYWSNGQTGSSISVITPGVYDVKYTDAYGCSSMYSTMRTVLPRIEFSRLIGKCLFACKTDNPVVSMPNFPFDTYTWHAGSATGPIVGTGYHFAPTTSGTYYLHVENTDNCEGDSGSFDVTLGSCGNCCKDGIAEIVYMTNTTPAPTCQWKFGLSYNNISMLPGDHVQITVSGATLLGPPINVTATGTSTTVSGTVQGTGDNKKICFEILLVPHTPGAKACTQEVCTYVNCPDTP